MKRQLVAFVLVVAGAACDRPAETTKMAAPNVAVSQVPSAVDTWERSRQCATDADRLASRLQRENAFYKDSPRVYGWSNHYNRKEGRCYVKVDYDHRPTVDLFHSELHDAIEAVHFASSGKRLQMMLWNEAQREFWCRVPDPKRPRDTTGAECTEAERFITERMTN
jgi:hypothetical protein